MAYDGKVLLRRPGAAHVFVVAPSGEVQRVPLAVPKGFSIFSLFVAGDVWVGQLTRRREGVQGLEILTYSFNPLTGKPIESYVFNEPVGLGLPVTRRTPSHS